MLSKEKIKKKIKKKQKLNKQKVALLRIEGITRYDKKNFRWNATYGRQN